MKKLISNTPLNKNFINDNFLKKRVIETVPYVKGDVLDIGCGGKPYEKIYNANVKSYTGIDLPSVHLYYSPDGGADAYGNALQLPFKSETFDAVISGEVLPHVDKASEALAEFARALKLHGILVLTANKSWEKRIGLPIPDYWRFTDEGLSQLARENELEVIYTKAGCGFFAMMGQLFARFLNKELIYRKAVYEGIDGKAIILAAIFILPLIAIVQVFFLLSERVYYSKIDTLFYILVARKRRSNNYKKK